MPVLNRFTDYIHCNILPLYVYVSLTVYYVIKFVNMYDQYSLLCIEEETCLPLLVVITSLDCVLLATTDIIDHYTKHNFY